MGKVSGGMTADYTWLADGTKLQVVDNSGDGYLYLGSLIYKRHNGDRVLESAGFGGGRIIASEGGAGSSGGSGTVYTPYYHLTDHLGSVRTVVTFENGQPNVVAQNDYYAFGLKHDNPILAVGSDTENRFLYNGKELQTTGNLDILDYGARMYDAVIGRFPTIDWLAEKFKSQSPYIYANNNPIRFIDYLGMNADENEDDTKYVDNQGFLLFETDDGLEDIIVVGDSNVEELEDKLNELDEAGEIDDPEANKEQLHPLGTKIDDLKNRLVGTGDSSVDTAISAGYTDGYSGKHWIASATIIGASMLDGDGKAKVGAGYVHGKSKGKSDKKAGRINKVEPHNSLKNNEPKIKLKRK